MSFIIVGGGGGGGGAAAFWRIFMNGLHLNFVLDFIVGISCALGLLMLRTYTGLFFGLVSLFNIYSLVATLRRFVLDLSVGHIISLN